MRLVAAGGVGAVETVEDVRFDIIRDAGTLVDDAKDEAAGCLSAA